MRVCMLMSPDVLSVEKQRPSHPQGSWARPMVWPGCSQHMSGVKGHRGPAVDELTFFLACHFSGITGKLDFFAATEIPLGLSAGNSPENPQLLKTRHCPSSILSNPSQTLNMARQSWMDADNQTGGVCKVPLPTGS